MHLALRNMACLVWLVGSVATAFPAAAGENGPWYDNIKLSGDLRLRYDTQRRDEGPGKEDIDRRRWRYRARFGFKAKVHETTHVGVRLASGSGFQNTTNQSYDGHARGKGIFIDRAYASYTPSPSFTLTGGKFKNPFMTSSLVWDSDVNLEGIGEQFRYEDGAFSIFGNVTQFFIEEMDLKAESNGDPWMFGIQGGFTAKPAKDVSVQAGVTFYKFMDLDLFESDAGGDLGDKTTFVGYNHSHSQQMVFDENDRLVNKFEVLELNVKLRFKTTAVPFGMFGTWIRNLDADVPELIARGVANEESDPLDLLAYGGDDRDQGYQLGFEVGSKNKAKDFYAKYIYQVLEDYAFPAAFVDSDFHGGGTNNRGHRVTANYFLTDNVYLQGVFFFTERESEAKDSMKDENRAQLDVILNF